MNDNANMVAGWVVQEKGSSRWGKVEEVANGKALVFFRGASPQ